MVNNMAGYKPTDEEIAALIRDLKEKDPNNANDAYARKMLTATKLMYRDLGRIDENILHEEMKKFSEEQG
jgi:RNA polymerase-interacting CarD/CdnL/TRCF family regulator